MGEKFWPPIIQPLIVAFLTWLATFLYGIPARRRARKNKLRAEEAEKQLMKIRRRANAPYLAPSMERVSGLYEEAPGANVVYWSISKKNVLSFFNDEVDKNTVPKNAPIIFVIENRGEIAQWIRAIFENTPAYIKQEANLRGAHNLQFLTYPYNPDEHGKRQLLKISFESHGIQDTHIYETYHGKRILNRIDPQ